MLSVKVQRLECLDCKKIRQENLHFVTGKHRYTNRFARLVRELSMIGTIKAAADFLHISWDTASELNQNNLDDLLHSPLYGNA